MRKLFFLLFIFVSACQQKQTIVTTENTSVLATEPSIRKLVTANTVIVDARAPFEFGLNHVPGSINMQWQDFSSPGSTNKTHLDRDKFKLARRLALLGIDPETPVLIVGAGKKGEGQEGRLAWMFKMLGLQKVTTMNYDLLKAQVANDLEVKPSSKPMWKPQDFEDYEIAYDDFYTLVKAHQVQHHLPPIPLKKGVRVGRRIQGVKLFVVDARDAKEANESMDPQQIVSGDVVLKMPWTDFWSEQGQVNHEAARTLMQKGVKPTDEIVVLSSTGIKASGVVFAMRELGFSNSQNLTGGLSYVQELKKNASPGAYQ